MELDQTAAILESARETWQRLKTVRVATGTAQGLLAWLPPEMVGVREQLAIALAILDSETKLLVAHFCGKPDQFGMLPLPGALWVIRQMEEQCDRQRKTIGDLKERLFQKGTREIVQLEMEKQHE